MKVEKLRVAIVGFGFMGKTHAQNILKSENMLLTAIVDSNINLNNRSGGNIETDGIAPDILSTIPNYRTLDDCLANESIDLAYICVHTLAHYELAMKSLENGLHVFIEKPFVLDVKEGHKLIEEAKRRNRKIGVGHVVRFMPAYSKLLDIYRNKTYGELKFISLSRFSGVPDWGDWKERRETFGSSGGALFDLVIHDIDFLQYMLGKPDEMYCNYIDGYLSKHDYINTFWFYDQSKINAKIEGGNIFPSQFPFEASYRALFENAAVNWSSGSECRLNIITDNEGQIITLENLSKGYQEEAEYFAKCILEDLYPEECSAESSLETIELCYRHVM